MSNDLRFTASATGFDKVETALASIGSSFKNIDSAIQITENNLSKFQAALKKQHPRRRLII